MTRSISLPGVMIALTLAHVVVMPSTICAAQDRGQDSPKSQIERRRVATLLQAEEVLHEPPTPTFGLLQEKSTLRALKLSDDQLRQCKELTRLTQGFLREATLAEAEAIGAPAQEEQRILAEIAVRKKRIAEHADGLLFLGILNGDQSERLQRTIWRVQGVKALSDEKLASRLGMTRLQRLEVSSRLAALARATNEMQNDAGYIGALFDVKQPDVGHRAYAEIQERIGVSKNAVVEILSPRQLAEWSRLISPESGQGVRDH